MTRPVRCAMALGLAGFAAACAGPTSQWPVVPAPDPVPVNELFVSFFEQRCVAPQNAGQRPNVTGLTPASDGAVSRYPTVTAFGELAGRSLSYWTAPEDPRGEVVLVVEEDQASERCASVTGAYSKEEFARILRASYPQYLRSENDDDVVNARVVLAVADPNERSKVYTIYHDEDKGTSALVMTLAEPPR